MAQQHMAMAGMGGPVGGQPANNTSAPMAHMNPDNIKRSLNTAIYEYMICNNQYDIARSILKALPVDTTDIKQSPKNQTNGIEDDSKENLNMKNRPDDLPAPNSLLPTSGDHPFLQDWWCQFWDLWKGQRNVGKTSTLQYVGFQRQAQKARQNIVGMDPNGLANGMRQQFPGQAGAADLRMQAMRQMAKPGMPPGRPNMANQAQGNAMQASAMERQGSAMNMSDARNSGSPNAGDNEPSPKRLRTEGSMSQLNQARQQPTGAQSVEQYQQAMKQQMQNLVTNSANPALKGVVPNPAAMGGPGGVAQQNVMGQQNMDSPNDFYGGRSLPPNGNNGAQAAQQGGNHALQDYQMQLMLLEQQNKKRLLMARQEQDNHGGMPNPVGAPNPGMIPPNIDPAMRAMMAQNGGQMRPPSSHPMDQQMQIMRANAQQMMQQNGFPAGQPGGPPGQMMPGQQPGQPPNMTPRQGNMAPPPAPNGATATANQPSSPAQPAAPPTPNVNKNAKNNKKDNKNSKAANKKGAAAAAAAAAAENADAPPTPTPPPAATPNAAAAFKNGNLPNGQPAAQAQQNPANGQAPNMQPNGDMGMPFGDLNADQFGIATNMEFADLQSSDVLDTFDFESFLNSNGEENGFGFDANIAFGDSSIEADLGS